MLVIAMFKASHLFPTKWMTHPSSKQNIYEWLTLFSSLAQLSALGFLWAKMVETRARCWVMLLLRGWCFERKKESERQVRQKDGEERTEKSQSIVFVSFVKLGKLSPSSLSLIDFNRVWLSLTEFASFRVFYPMSHDLSVLTHKIVRLYKSTREFDNHDHEF